MKKLLVIGHKNPDIDSTASASAYAELKKKLGYEAYAASPGLPSSRAEYLFRRFEVDLPPVVKDVYPRVRDILKKEYASVPVDRPVMEAMDLLHRFRQRQLPVVDHDNVFKGIIDIFDLSNYFFANVDPDASEADDASLMSRTVQTSFSYAAAALKGSFLRKPSHDSIQHYDVYVGAMSRESMLKRMEAWDISKTILVLGDRLSMQKIVIEKGVPLIVVTGNTAVSEEVLELADEKGTSILRTPFDSASTVRRLKFSTPVHILARSDTDTFGSEDKLCDIRHLIYRSNRDVFPVLDPGKKLIGVFSRMDFESDPATGLVLVDHNELVQAVDGATELPLLEVVDHHRMGMAPTDKPIRITADAVGSTCTLVAEEFRRSNLSPDPGMAGVLLGGVIMDTLHLASPTATQRDREIITWLSGVAGVDSEELYREIFSVGSVVAGSSPEDVLNSDRKEYEQNGVIFSISQVEETGFEHFYERRSEIETALRKLSEERNIDLATLLVTNVVRRNSILLVTGESRIIDALPYGRIDARLFDLPGVLSRKKELLPVLLKVSSSL